MPEEELVYAPEPEPEPIPLTPVARQERIATMDVLRGMAVFGIFLINMPLYVAPSAGFFDWQNNAVWSDPIDRFATLFIYIFAQAKFYTLFSFLFGLGFGVQMLRAAERHSPNFLSTYRRRLAVLLIIGLLHFTLIWWGDVLHVYAILGFGLLQFRKRSTKTLLILAAVLTFGPFVLAVGGTTISRLTDKKTVAEKEKERKESHEKSAKRIEEDTRTKSTGTILQILKLRFKRNLRQLGGEVFWGIELFASFLLGLAAARVRIFQEPDRFRPLLTRLAYIALPLAIVYSAIELTIGYLYPGDELPLWRLHLNFFREFVARPAMAFGYAAVLLLAGVRTWMGPFAAVGRMALTNYLLCSLVFTTIANSYGLGLYGKIHPIHGLILCFAFYALQLPLSVWWLRNYNYGPVEWLWRSLTYGFRQPWAKASA
ncbi:MAG: DUF418 domain-containing protein [Acidobacteria bacterium]|nr:DUF418 domain-containing protein [Acidobacteriota bacterium]